jgi:hypothetical protein
MNYYPRSIGRLEVVKGATLYRQNTTDEAFVLPLFSY